ncbi:MAG: TIGR04372 family glycosyltransferase [Alphaproteobacteria bacterium]|nr:TIGR04372 family glycosyltransferase [Alphaproteobacteria bacterium]
MKNQDTADLLKRLSAAKDKGDTVGAEAMLRALVERTPGAFKMRLAWGSALFTLGRATEAEAVFRQAICISPGWSGGWMKHGYLLLALRRPEDASLVFQMAYLLEPDRAKIVEGIARARAECSDWAAAEPALRRALALNPRNGATHYWLAKTLQGLGRLDEISGFVLPALSLGCNVLLKEFHALARHLAEAGLPAEASKILKLLVKMLPDDCDGHMELAMVTKQIAVTEGRHAHEPSLIPQCPAFAPMSMTYQDKRTLAAHAPPFRIFAQLTTMSFAGFIAGHVFAATIKQQFSNAHLTMYFRPDRPFKEDIVALNPYIDVLLRPGESKPISLDHFELDYATYAQPLKKSDPRWYQNRRSWVDFMITSSMMSDLRLMGFEHVAKLKVPDARVAELSEQLVELGLDPNRWFCALHYREPSWTYVKPNWLRDGNPATFETVVHQIIRQLGGQVVRLGHKGMTPFAPVAGFVDLSEHSTLLQAFAVSRARFLVNGASGPVTLACAFGVPILGVNAVDIWGGWGKGHSILMQHVFTPEGYRISARRAQEDELISTQALSYLVKKRGYRIIQNSAEEIMAGVRVIGDETADVAGWRAQADQTLPPPPNRLTWPPPIAMPWRLLEFPHLAPPGPVIE